MTLGQIKIDGLGTFTVDASFEGLSPDDQHKAVSEMETAARAHLASQASANDDNDGRSHGLLAAVKNSLVNGLPEAVHSGEAAFGNYMKGSTVGNFLDKLPGSSMADSAAAATASANQDAADSASSYSRPSSVPSGLVNAVTGANGIGDGAVRVGKALAYGAAENAAPLGANLALSAVPGLGEANAVRLAGSLGLGTLDGLQALGGVRDAKMRAGLSGDTTSTGDMGNAALQLMLMRAGGGAGVPSTLGKFAGRAAGIGQSAAKGALQPVANDVGAIVQGGDLADGKGATANAAQIGMDALEGAGAGAGLHSAAMGAGAIGRGAGSIMGAISDNQHLAKLGGTATLDELTQNQAKAQGWSDAVGQAKDTLAKQYPGAADDDLTTMAEQQAGKAGLEKPGDLSANAQRLQDDVNTLGIYSSRQQASDGSASQKPAQVMKGGLSDIRADLTATAAQWKRAGTITPDDHAVITTALAEATAHNRALGTGNDGHSLTPYQRIGDIDGLSDDQKGQVQSLLRVADTLSQNALLKNQHGFLGSLGKGIGTAVGHAVASPLHVLPVVGHAAAGAVGHAVGGIGKQIGASLDAGLGVGLPDILARQGVIQAAAAKAGIVPTVTAKHLQGLRDDSQAGLGVIAAAKAQAAQQRAQDATRQAQMVASVRGAYGPGDPGWMASIAKDHGITTDSIRRFLASGVAGGGLTQGLADHLSSTDNIGGAMGPLATAIRGQVQAGQWDRNAPPAPAPQPAPTGPAPGASGPQQAPSGQPGPQGAPVTPQPAPVLPPLPQRAPVLNVPAPTPPPGAPARSVPGASTVPVVPPAPQVAATVSGGPLPVDVASLLQRRGTITPSATGPSSPLSPLEAARTLAGPPPASSVRDPLIYQAVVARDQGMQKQIADANPALAPVVNAMAHGKSPQARRGIMENALAAMFGNDLGHKAAARIVLEPFSNFGKGRN